ncbi:DUF6644 family protein [Undibacterium sp. SXout7W]|uniref:DUF6644 family protein n=1 Tax=Undibacterium sp. SXout7W TaxID=3413049 RepID=UPI003BF1F89A
MSIYNVFELLQNNPLSDVIRRQDHLFGATAQLLHIVGIIFVLSPIVLISLRLLGFGILKQSSADLFKATAGFIWAGLALLVISGLAIFLPVAKQYYPNPIFWFKFILLFSVIVLHITWYRRISKSESPRPFVAKATAVVALTSWFGVAYAGRFIGFF